LVLLVRKNQILGKETYTPIGRIFRWTEQFQHFAEEVKESFWGDLYGQTKQAWKRFLEKQSRKERDGDVGGVDYARAGKKRRGYRNGFYVRDFVTRLGTLRLRIARARDQSFRPPGPGAVALVKNFVSKRFNLRSRIVTERWR
jgi:hypothetical protein